MPNSTDPALIKFLTGDRNVACVLEVLRHGEAIRDNLSKRFWSELRTHLIKAGPTNVGNKLKWETDSESHGAKGQCDWLDSLIPEFKDCPQSLFYRIEYWAWPQGLDLYYGLHWTKETRASSKFFSTKPLLNLRRLLTQEEYDLSEPEWWYGWRYARKFFNADEFLSFFVENRKFLFQTIGEGFWPFVERTFNHVEKVNRSLRN